VSDKLEKQTPCEYEPEVQTYEDFQSQQIDSYVDAGGQSENAKEVEQI